MLLKQVAAQDAILIEVNVLCTVQRSTLVNQKISNTVTMLASFAYELFLYLKTTCTLYLLTFWDHCIPLLAVESKIIIFLLEKISTQHFQFQVNSLVSHGVTFFLFY